MVVWLHLTPMRSCLDAITWDASPWCWLLHVYLSPFFALCDDMLAMLVYATRWLYMHLYTFAYMSTHDSCLLVCWPCFNTMKLWTFDPNLHLSLVDTTFHLLSCLFACFIVSLLAMSTMLIHFMPFYMLFASFPSIACLLVSCLCLCMYTHGARTYRARARSPRHKQKGRRCEHVSISQAVVFSRFRGLAFPVWFCTL